MNVVVVSDSAGINGGAAKVAISSAVGLANLGHKVTLLAGFGPPDPSLESAGVDVSCLEVGTIPRSLRGVRSGLWNPQVYREMDRLLKAQQVEDTVVHLHGFRDSLTASVFQPVFARGFPCVLTAHDYGIACPYGGFFDYRTRQICNLRGGSFSCWTSGCNAGSRLRKGWFNIRHSMQSKLVPKELRHLIVLSDLSESVLRPYLPETCRTHRVDNPVDVEPIGKMTPSDDLPFLFVGALVRHKDPEIAARAAGKVGARLRVLGSGVLEDSLKSNASVDFEGWAGSDAVQAAMRSSRALVFPSIWYEAQPLTVLEAMANGLPVIASDASAARESVARYGGKIFRTGDEAHLAECMQELAGASLLKLGRDTHDAYWADPMTLSRHLVQLEKVYAEVLSNRQ